MFKACVKNARYYQNYKKRNKMKLKGKLRSFYEDVMLKIVFLFDCSAITHLIDITLYFLYSYQGKNGNQMKNCAKSPFIDTPTCTIKNSDVELIRKHSINSEDGE